MERLDALGDAGLRETLLFVRARAEPPTAAEVATGLAVAPSVARWRLERLTQAGLLVPTFVRRSGRTGPGAGRPAKTYAAAPETAAIEFPSRRHAELLRLLIAALPGRGRAEQLADVGVEFGRELAAVARLRPARTAATALKRICSGLGRLGFHAALESATPEGAVVVSATCPLRPLVAETPVAQAIDQGMWRGLVEQGLEGVDVADVRCTTHDCLDGDAQCRIAIAFARRASEA